jgi:hypothetical protein
MPSEGWLRAWFRIEEAAGPGLDLTLQRGRFGPVITGARPGGSFLGLDRAVVADTDTGDGTLLAAVVALPSSSAAGCWLEAEVCGALLDQAGQTVIVATLPGHPRPALPLVRVVARSPGAELADASTAGKLVRRARERYRRRVAEGRRTGRPAWLPVDVDTREVTGASIASGAELGLSRLPTRFVRGLQDLLDEDERILATVERPAEEGGGLLAWRRQRDRRAALLVLTDRELLWLVDHVAPDRYLMDWGVDAELLPLERLVAARVFRDGVTSGGSRCGLQVRTGAGEIVFNLPADLHGDVEALGAVLEPFLPQASSSAVRRRYPVDPIEFDAEPAERHRQGAEATERIENLRRLAEPVPVLAAFYAPRRERVKQSVAVALTVNEVLMDAGGPPRRMPLVTVQAISLALSPLIGRVELRTAGGPARFSYPSPLSEQAAAFTRLLRRAWANT